MMQRMITEMDKEPRYVNANEVLACIDNAISDYANDDDVLKFLSEIRFAVIGQPDVNVQEVKHGYWILEREPNGKPYCFHCSVCDDDFHYISILTKYPYCPNCGAKMDGGEKQK